MTVRFPDGISIQYNTANYVFRSAAGYTDLYTQKDGQWIAQVPNSAVIEVVSACRVYKATTDYRDDRLMQVEKELRNLKLAVRKVLKANGK